MYRRVSNRNKRKNRGRNTRKVLAALAITSGLGIVSLVLALTVMAAPEDPAVEEAAALLAAESISENEAVPEDPLKNPGVPVVMVDPGHGGMDNGCSNGDILEKNVNLEIARLLEGKLLAAGYQVIMAREDDTYIAKEQRVERANQYSADIYVSIHQNDFEEESATGIETWYYGGDTSRDSKRLARLVHQETLKKTGAKERELKSDAEFLVTGKTTMPACLIETGFLSNQQECQQLKGAEYQELVAEGIFQGIDLYLRPKTMYLTFDDGPSSENTVAVLDFLKARNIKATFFVVGENVRKHPEIAKRIVDEGHTIGIHCYQHEYEKIYRSLESYLLDFEAAYQAVLEVTGVEAKLFRFPGGSINAYDKEVSGAIIQEMTARGFTYFDWNASLEDAVKQSKPEQLVANARATALDRRKVVMLAHDIIYNTTLCLEKLIEEFPEYKMEALTAEVEPVQFPQ